MGRGWYSECWGACTKLAWAHCAPCTYQCPLSPQSLLPAPVFVLEPVYSGSEEINKRSQRPPLICKRKGTETLLAPLSRGTTKVWAELFVYCHAIFDSSVYLGPHTSCRASEWDSVAVERAKGEEGTVINEVTKERGAGGMICRRSVIDGNQVAMWAWWPDLAESVSLPISQQSVRVTVTA